MGTKVIQEKYFREAPGRKINPDRQYGNQCVDLVDEYAQVIFGVPWEKCVGGVRGASDLMKRVPDEYWIKVYNDPANPNQLPERGDVVVYAGLGEGSANPFGHTLVNLLADMTGMQVLQQDGFKPPLIWIDGNGYSDAPAEVSRLGYWNAGTGMIAGWLRPRPEKIAGSDVSTVKPAAGNSSAKYLLLTDYFPAQTSAANCPKVFGQGAREILADIIHWWNDPNAGSTFESVTRQFKNNPASGSSSNWIVEAGRALNGVAEANASHANGNAWANVKTVTYECNPRCSDGDYETIAELISDRWIARGYTTVGSIFGHNRYYATRCPGNYDLDRVRRMTAQKFAAKRGTTGVVPTPSVPKPRPTQPPIAQPAPPTVPGNKGYYPDPHWVVEPGEYMGQIAEWAKTDVGTLSRYNGIANANNIRVGEWIWPPTGADTYVVDPGDTLSKIVAYYHSQGHGTLTVDKIQNANGINNPATETTVGRRLQIPK